MLTPVGSAAATRAAGIAPNQCSPTPTYGVGVEVGNVALLGEPAGQKVIV